MAVHVSIKQLKSGDYHFVVEYAETPRKSLYRLEWGLYRRETPGVLPTITHRFNEEDIHSIQCINTNFKNEKQETPEQMSIKNYLFFNRYKVTKKITRDWFNGSIVDGDFVYIKDL